ncbi:hypothetical protein BGZ83_003115 [Gryganskiella cystojenkinii]|nr:hypothetical protein BGZ83_003115 [Gryganskiella cystojenkinii]
MAFLVEGKWESPIDCAQAFYDKFVFQSTKKAIDIFRRTVRSIDAEKHPWVEALRAEMKTQEFLAAEKDYLDNKKSRERAKNRQSTSMVASALAKTLSRGTLRTSFQLLRSGTDKVGGLAMTEISSRTSSSQSPGQEGEEHDTLDNADDDVLSDHEQQQAEDEEQDEQQQKAGSHESNEGQDPPLPAVPSGLSSTHNEMYHAALQRLLEPGDVTKKKPVL